VRPRSRKELRAERARSRPFRRRSVGRSLVKLVLCSAAIHQICYVCSSTMNFAVGQVQDAGLIFLSAMARFTVRRPARSPSFSLPSTMARSSGRARGAAAGARRGRPEG